MTKSGTPATRTVAVSRSLLPTEPTGFEPAIFCVTGRHVRPLHHGSWCTFSSVDPSGANMIISEGRLSCQVFLQPISQYPSFLSLEFPIYRTYFSSLVGDIHDRNHIFTNSRAACPIPLSRHS